MRRKHVLSAEGSKAPVGLERRVLQGPCPGLDLKLSGHQGSQRDLCQSAGHGPVLWLVSYGV